MNAYLQTTIRSARYANHMAIRAAQEGRGGHAHDWRIWRNRSMAAARMCVPGGAA